jgi:Ran GTPase-activating protein (RanGAP) involved in mRNA processing and transport
VGPIQLSIRGILTTFTILFFLTTGKITTLDIGNNNIGSKGAFHVAEYIKKAKSVQWLNLYMNDIGDQGAERIADALKRNKSISTIDLGGNNISAKGTSDIASALKENSTITTVCEVFYSFAIVWLIESELVSEQPALLHIILEFHLKAWQL